MTKKQSEHFIADRTEALACVKLTDRPDLVIQGVLRQEGDPFVTLTVEIRDDARPRSRERFGVYLQGSKDPLTTTLVNGRMNKSLRRFFDDHAEPTLPFCLFYYTMRDNQGYFNWIAEPVIDAGQPRLRYHREEADCAPLDLRSLDSIVDSVNAFYLALRHSAIVAG